MNRNCWFRITRSGLSFLLALFIFLSGCSGSPSGNTPVASTGVSPTTPSATGSAPSLTTTPATTASARVNTPTTIRTTGATPTAPIRTATATSITVTSTWSVRQSSNIVQIAYGSGASNPQYGALDVNSGYFRLNYGPGSGWGTSIVLLPAFWSKTACAPGGYCQGAPVVPAWQIVGSDLALTITGTIGGLRVTTSVRLSPPAKNSIMARVSTSVQGNITLDARPGEAYKPVMLSSMHISSTQWDAQFAYAGGNTIAFPVSGWIVQPPVNAQTFGLRGGTSSWKINAPTVQITMDRSQQVTGWVTADNNPNDDNVGFWSATDTVVSSWGYTVVVTAP
jgi:hypothetical protein